MDEITKELAELILSTNVWKRAEVEKQSRMALADYIGALLAGSREETPKRLALFLAHRPGYTPVLGFSLQTTSEEAALLYGFTSHYLDFDDAQANLMGHFSTVLFSVLLALADEDTDVNDFFSAYVAGAEIEGLLGAIVNPYHKQQGWHPTATLGPIGGTAAIARLKHLSLSETAQLLSLGATQSSGLGLEAGSDAKPLHAGLAAANSIRAYELLVDCQLTASDSPFNAKEGWIRTISGKDIKEGYFRKHWLKPGQLLSPGLWMKEHQYCSAAITGAAAVKALYEEGLRMGNVKKVTFHFPPGNSYSLHYHKPQTGQQGRFSMEYVAWQILTYGDVKDELFTLSQVPKEFLQSLSYFQIQEDLPPVSQEVRRILVTVEKKNGTVLEKEIPHPPGSPARPFTWKEVEQKIGLGSDPSWAAGFIHVLQKETSSWKDIQEWLFKKPIRS